MDDSYAFPFTTSSYIPFGRIQGLGIPEHQDSGIS